MKNCKLAIFDVDGTLLDTREGILAAVKYTVDEFRLPPLADADIATFIGPPIQDSFAKFYGLSGSILQEIATVFRDRYKSVDLLKATPYEGIYEVFEGLKKSGIATAVATYKRHDYADKIVRHFGFGEYTDVIFGADHENKLKKKDIIQKCIETCDVEQSESVMIGDSMSDAVGAESLGISFLAVTYGYGFASRKDCNGVKKIGIAEKPKDILNILTRG